LRSPTERIIIVAHEEMAELVAALVAGVEDAAGERLGLAARGA
jgi:hypothetical protein